MTERWTSRLAYIGRKELVGGGGRCCDGGKRNCFISREVGNKFIDEVEKWVNCSTEKKQYHQRGELGHRGIIGNVVCARTEVISLCPDSPG